MGFVTEANLDCKGCGRGVQSSQASSHKSPNEFKCFDVTPLFSSFLQHIQESRIKKVYGELMCSEACSFTSYVMEPGLTG